MKRKKDKIKGQEYYQCGICGFFYREKDLAQRCENFCNEHKSCSLEITKYAVHINERRNKKWKEKQKENLVVL